MNSEDFILYLKNEGWGKRSIDNKEIDKNWEDFEYERSYADFIYDNLTIWKKESRVSVLYHIIEWGYTTVENHDFTFEEFVEWWENIKNY
jgi:hypothetical protein